VKERKIYVFFRLPLATKSKTERVSRKLNGLVEKLNGLLKITKRITWETKRVSQKLNRLVEKLNGLVNKN
jgi:hypothetical protein